MIGIQGNALAKKRSLKSIFFGRGNTATSFPCPEDKCSIKSSKVFPKLHLKFIQWVKLN